MESLWATFLPLNPGDTLLARQPRIKTEVPLLLSPDETLESRREIVRTDFSLAEFRLNPEQGNRLIRLRFCTVRDGPGEW